MVWKRQSQQGNNSLKTNGITLHNKLHSRTIIPQEYSSNVLGNEMSTSLRVKRLYFV